MGCWGPRVVGTLKSFYKVDEFIPTIPMTDPWDWCTCIYLHERLISMVVNVGEYTIHGSYGIGKQWELMDPTY